MTAGATANAEVEPSLPVGDLRRLLALARPQRAAFTRAAAAAFLVSALYLAAAVLLAQALGRLLSERGVASALPLIVAAVAVAGVRAVVLYLGDIAAATAAAEVKSGLRARLTAKVLDLGPGWLTATRSGWVQSMLVDGVERMESVYSRLLTQTGVSFTVGLVTCGFVLSLDPVVGAITLGCLLLMPVTVVLTRFAMRRTGAGWWTTYRGMFAEYLDAIQGMPTLKVAGASRRHGAELGGRADRLRDQAVALATREILFGLIVNAAVGVASVLALGIGALRVAGGDLAPQDLLLILLLVRECFRPVAQLLNGFHAAYYGLIAARPMFALLDEPAFVPEVASVERRAVPRTRQPPRLAFEDVSFGYPGRATPALDGLDLTVEPGEAVALVGASGAGKSTAASLLLRFWDPQAGRLTLDGVDIHELALVDLRSQIALVSQDTHLLHGTVAHNLRLARPDADDDALWQALETAAAADFVHQLPDGLDSIVGERGMRLSGGERQRVAIARALLKDAPVLILDEATSSLDVRSEAVVQAGLERLRQGRTTLVIAHRLSTAASADRIFVLDRGRVVEQGAPGELREAGGRFERLVAAQRVSR